jgi:hypothetical protein
MSEQRPLRMSLQLPEMLPPTPPHRSTSTSSQTQNVTKTTFNDQPA